MDFVSTPLGIFLLVIGFGSVLWKKKRKFDRTNSSGIEQFSSFGGKMAATALDGFLAWFSLVFLFLGLLVLSVQYWETWGWIVLLPVWAVVLFIAM